LAASANLRKTRLIDSWIAAVIVPLILICAIASRPANGEPVAQPKRVVMLYSYGENFQPWASTKAEGMGLSRRARHRRSA